jgi:ketosteroid isomerase-like protein
MESGAGARDRSRLEAWFATWKGPIGWELRDAEIAVARDIAFGSLSSSDALALVSEKQVQMEVSF